MGTVFGRKSRPSRVTEQDKAILIHIMDLQLTNLQHLYDTIISIWTRISEECFQHVVESMPLRIKQLKQQRDKLKQYQKRITLQLEKERLLAKQLLQDGKKEKALLLLKKKRYQDQLLDKTENQISNLERLVQDIEFMQIEMKVIEGLKVGNDCLKSMHEIMSIEDVEKILDETQESIEYQKQIDEMLAGVLTQEDEDAVLAELEAITQGEDVALPEVPTEPIPEVSEAARAEPERREAKNKPGREMLAA